MQDSARLFETFLPDLPSRGMDLPALIATACSSGPARARLSELQSAYYRDWLQLWSDPPQATAPNGVDHRFDAPEWRELPWFRFLHGLHALNSRYLGELSELPELDAKQKHQVRFVMRQLADAACPANFAATNPEAIKAAFGSRGGTIARGMTQLAQDLSKGRISMTDESAFEVGRNLAVTPGDVIFENELIQLIQYRAGTNEVFEQPLLIVPPFINKYYILDLRPENSFVRYCVQRGFTTYTISWRNVPADLGHLSWDDYIAKGVFPAIEAAREVSAAPAINTLGFCVGGTLLACALAVQAAKRRKTVSSVTLLASMLDFSDVGDIGAYVDPAYVAQCDREFKDGGVMPGARLAATFATLRSRELIWHFVVNNYLLGQPPKAFDLLYWNADSCNLPGVLYRYYLRNMYFENNLAVPGKLSMQDVAVDLSRIRVPAFVFAAREDHIVPWKTAYRSARLLGGETEFVLGASGHVAGVINPAASQRREHWIGGGLPPDPDLWLAAAQQRAGSWWQHWSDWLSRRSGKRVPAPTACGNSRFRILEPAPGRYVRDRGQGSPV
jgi:polyhydroxyalkanoate synthase